MFIILAYLATATINLQGSMLIIDNESIIDTNLTMDYNTSTSCVITSEEDVTIQDNAFQGFSSLQNISITANQISINANSFTGCSAINSVTLNSPKLNIEPGSFSSATSLSIKYQGSSYQFTNSKPWTYQIWQTLLQ